MGWTSYLEDITETASDRALMRGADTSRDSQSARADLADSAELVRAGEQLWLGTFERQLADLLALLELTTVNRHAVQRLRQQTHRYLALRWSQSVAALWQLDTVRRREAAWLRRLEQDLNLLLSGQLEPHAFIRARCLSELRSVGRRRSRAA